MTQKSAEQRELAESFIDDVVNATDNNGELDPYRKTRLTRELIALLKLERTAERFRLSKEAEQELGPTLDEAFRHWAACDEKGEECGEWQAREAVAAWLREKAR